MTKYLIEKNAGEIERSLDRKRYRVNTREENVSNSRELFEVYIPYKDDDVEDIEKNWVREKTKMNGKEKGCYFFWFITE